MAEHLDDAAAVNGRRALRKCWTWRCLWAHAVAISRERGIAAVEYRRIGAAVVCRVANDCGAYSLGGYSLGGIRRGIFVGHIR